MKIIARIPKDVFSSIIRNLNGTSIWCIPNDLGDIPLDVLKSVSVSVLPISVFKTAPTLCSEIFYPVTERVANKTIFYGDASEVPEFFLNRMVFVELIS